MTLTLTIFAALGISAVAWLASRRRKFPPGPAPYPIIGNLFDFPALANMSESAQAWKQRYGDIVHLTAFGTHLIILNNLETVIDLFDKQGILYSSRPHFPMVGELCGFDRLPAIASDGLSPRLRSLRKALNSEISYKACIQYEDIMKESVNTYLHKLRTNPSDFSTHIRWLAVDIIMQISYGYKVSLNDDYHMESADRIMRRLSHDARPGTWAVDIFPIMRYMPEWLPFTAFKRYARQVRSELDEWVIKPWELVKNQKITAPSFASRLMDQYPDLTPDDEDIIIWSSASIYSAGSDTTISALTTFFLSMALFPEAQAKAQEEIDNFRNSGHGTNDLPSFENRGQVPYVCALLLEVLRWGAILPLGAPRKATESNFYKGFEIPKNSTVLPNMWGICHDPEVFADSMNFEPSRFLGDKPELDPRSIIFGFGRRFCPGKYLAEQSLYTAIVNTLAEFKISAIKDSPPAVAFDEGFISHPRPFVCNIQPRLLDDL